MTHEITWRQNKDFPHVYEAVIDVTLAGWITHRPHYCDRGHWQAQVEIAGIDNSDAFPRYFMRFETAKQELEDFLKWRLWKIPAPGQNVAHEIGV